MAAEASRLAKERKSILQAWSELSKELKDSLANVWLHSDQKDIELIKESVQRIAQSDEFIAFLRYLRDRNASSVSEKH